jgi:hypothetical protein
MRVSAGLSCTLVAVAAAALLSACGGSAGPATPAVKLSLSAPGDGARVQTSTVTITGAVSPRDARVLVVGHRATTSPGGEFSATVSLIPGTNLVDMIASAPHARPAMSVVRIVRYVLVSVPDVTGESPSDAAAAIRGAGLSPKLHGDTDPFSFLLPLSEEVCSQTPAGGDHVAPNTTVTISIGKLCG